MDELLKQIDNKRELVRVTRDALKRAIENRSLTSIERQKGTITKTANEIYELKVNVQAIRIERETRLRIFKHGQKILIKNLRYGTEKLMMQTKPRRNGNNKRTRNLLAMREQEKVAEARREIHEEQLEFDKIHFEQKLQHEMKLEKARKEHVREIGEYERETTKAWDH